MLQCEGGCKLPPSKCNSKHFKKKKPCPSPRDASHCKNLTRCISTLSLPNVRLAPSLIEDGHECSSCEPLVFFRDVRILGWLPYDKKAAKRLQAVMTLKTRDNARPVRHLCWDSLVVEKCFTLGQDFTRAVGSKYVYSVIWSANYKQAFIRTRSLCLKFIFNQNEANTFCSK